MNKLIIALAATGLLGSSIAMAGPGGTTCAAAEEMVPGGLYSGDTSAAGYENLTNSFGLVPSPAADAYYTFTSDGQATGTFDVTANYDSGVALVSSCGNNASLLRAEGAPAGTPYSVIVDNGAGAPLTAGTQYWVIVTGIPTGTAADVGPFNVQAPDPLPVSLQSFSID
jgi:hypothetical protein